MRRIEEGTEDMLRTLVSRVEGTGYRGAVRAMVSRIREGR